MKKIVLVLTGNQPVCYCNFFLLWKEATEAEQAGYIPKCSLYLWIEKKQVVSGRTRPVHARAEMYSISR